MTGKFDASEYVDVAERIRQFADRYPDGSLQSEITMVDGGVLAKAYAYRSPDDVRPGIGHAYEPVPGKTPFTRDSEVMNAETSAWGRAIVALGFETKKIASTEEVRNRLPASAMHEGRDEPTVPVPKSYAELEQLWTKQYLDVEWLRQAVDAFKQLNGDKVGSFQMLARAYVQLAEEGPDSGIDFSRDQIRRAFASLLDGAVLDGPSMSEAELNALREKVGVAVPGEEDIPFGEEDE